MPKEAFTFLRELKKNNDREWFATNKQRYEKQVLEPALSLIHDLQKPMDKIAPLISVEPKRVGGSLMRVYRDTRFSSDKTPYKTNIGIHFRHRAGKDVHAPAIYIHLSPEESFFGAGTWRPAADALKLIRNYLADNPAVWKKVRQNKVLNQQFKFHDDRLKSAPRGFDKTHPLIDDLRLKSFIVTKDLTTAEIQSPELVPLIVSLTRQARPLMIALCQALGQPYV